jgi:predicted 2-oxoglutarate/Fe(II)-dependent dioxygenase YbiX
MPLLTIIVQMYYSPHRIYHFAGGQLVLFMASHSHKLTKVHEVTITLRGLV